MAGTAFFVEANTEGAVHALASGPLTIIVGAGVPIESRLPAWGQLVSGLLMRGAKTVLPPNSGEDLREKFANWAIRTDGLLAGATLARAIGQVDRDISGVLYEASGQAPVPGPSARALARLVVDTGCRVVTTNYDETIESAIDDHVGRAGAAVAVTAAPAGRPDVHEVPHLHGLLRRGRSIGRVILSEQDYFELRDDAWQEEYIRSVLEAGPCLFVGSSMSDPNLLRYLHRASPNDAHFAVLVRQGDAFLRDETPEPAVEDARFTAASRRWAALGITALQPAFFYESAQFLYELLARRRGDLVGGYRARLDRWIRAFDDTYMSADPARFARAQDVLQSQLSTLKATVCDVVSGATSLRDERFGVGLWALRPANALLLIGSSDRAHREVDTLDAVPLSVDSSWASVDAFTTGTSLVRDATSRFGTRWNTVVAFPISVESPAYGRLQVGVVTIGGTAPLGSSALKLDRLGPDAFDDLTRLANDYGSQLLLATDDTGEAE